VWLAPALKGAFIPHFEDTAGAPNLHFYFIGNDVFDCLICGFLYLLLDNKIYIMYCDKRQWCNKLGGPSEREYVEKLGKMKQKLNQKVGDVKKQFEKIEKAKVDLLKKTKERRHEAEREISKMENDIAKSKDLALESKRRLRLEIDTFKSEIRERYAELEAQIAEAIAPA